MKKENFYNNLADQFSDDLPEGHLERFDKKLQALHRVTLKKRLFAYSAAVAVVVISFAITILMAYHGESFKQSSYATEFLETQTYYTAAIKNKMNQLSG